jgi:hypothetical protein
VGRKLHTKFGVDPTVSEFCYDFFKQNPRLYLAAVTSSSVTSHRAYHRTILGWQETSTPSLAQIGQFLIFFTNFSSKIRIQSDCRDVIDDDIEPSLLSN